MSDVFLPSHSSILARRNKLWNCEHWSKHGPDATPGPYGPYRDWPPKTGADTDNQGVPRAPGCEMADTEGGLLDPMSGEALAPLQLKGFPRDPTPDPTAEV
jgi:hypothetical protein